MIVLTFNFNLKSYCTSTWHGMVSEHVGNVGTPGIAGDTRCTSGSPQAGITIASCRMRKLTLVGTEKWRSNLGARILHKWVQESYVTAYGEGRKQNVQFLGMRYINKKFLTELVKPTTQNCGSIHPLPPYVFMA
jgi:hypothetical protein